MRHTATLRYVDAVVRAGSIRKAAESLAITSTALNRRILALEADLGAPIFERLPRGVRLTTAGELLIHHVRTQLSDLERVRSQISDLSGVRRGHVSIACSQALLPYFLPDEIARYRREHPAVTFSVARRDRAAAEQALADHSADLAIVFEPVRFGDFQTLASSRQRLHAVIATDHPLATKTVIRLSDCVEWPVALPTGEYGVRHILDLAARRGSVRLSPAVESDSFEFLRSLPAAEPGLISFQIPIGLTRLELGMTARPIDLRDAPEGLLYVGQLRGRTLPVASARFADRLADALRRASEDLAGDGASKGQA